MFFLLEMDVASALVRCSKQSKLYIGVNKLFFFMRVPQKLKVRLLWSLLQFPGLSDISTQGH
jgi:hypothetical protein